MNKKKRKLKNEYKYIRRRRVFSYTAIVLLGGLMCVGILKLSTVVNNYLPVIGNDNSSSINREIDSSQSTSKLESNNQAPFNPNANIIVPDENLIGANICSKYVLLYDVSSGQVLYQKNANERLYPASTTKIMTASVAMEFLNEDMTFTTGEEQQFIMSGSSVAFDYVSGLKLNLRMLMNGVMVPSGNDAAYLTAINCGRIIAGDESLDAKTAVSTFMEVVNNRLQTIGATDTHFVTPDGWHNPEHYTTALDLLRITLYSKQYPLIAEVGSQSYVKQEFLEGGRKEWSNSNFMINENSGHYYEYATGLKTGYTTEAGLCLVATAEKNGKQLIAILMKAENGADRWDDYKRLFDAGFEYIEKNN